MDTQKDETNSSEVSGRMQRLVRCFCVPAADGTNNVIAYACDEEGNKLSQHYCSGSYWAKKDIMDECHHHRYPEGFVLEWVDSPPANWNYQPN